MTLSNKKIGIIGVGYVGGAVKKFIPSAKAFDKNNKFDSLAEVLEQDYIFVAVPTPYNLATGFDRSIIAEVMEQIAGVSKRKVVIIKSTIAPGTTDYFQDLYPHLKVIFNPEFLTEARAWDDFINPERQIIGYTDQSRDVASEVLNLLPPAGFSKLIPARTAEIVKYFNNSWYATKVTFANQMYDLCEQAKVDYELVKECAAADKRMTGTSHLEIWHNGFRGYGGKCLPKDTRALIEYADNLGVDLSLLKKVEEINNNLRKGQDRHGE